jgi:teichuronic acid exporter
MQDIQSIKRKSVIGVVSYTLRTAFLYGVGIIATLALGYYLTPEDFGIYFIVTAVIGIFTFISDIGLAAALVQKKEKPTLLELRTTFTVQQILAFVIFFGILALTPFWREGFGVRSYTIAVLARSIGGVIVLYCIQGWQIGLALSKDALRSLMKFGVKFQVNDLLARLKDDVFIVVLARFLQPAEMGYISWAKRWSMFPYQFSVNSVMAVTFPTFSRLQEHSDKLKRAVEKSLFFITLVIFPILGGMVVLAEPALQTIPKYTKWLPALPSLMFFCINIAWAAVSTPLTNTLNAIGKISSTLKLMVMWTVLTWTITPVAVWKFGFLGVAIAAAVVACSSIVTFWMVKKYVQVQIIENIWRQAVATIVMIGALLYESTFLPHSYLGLGVAVLMGGCVYLITLAILGFSVVKREIESLFRKG